MLGGGSGSILDMIVRLRENNKLLGKKSFFKKSFREKREELFRAAQKGKIKFRDATKEELAAVREKVLADRRKRSRKMAVVYSMITIAFIVLAIPITGFYLGPMPLNELLVDRTYLTGLETKNKARYDFFIQDAESWLRKNQYHNALFQYKKALELYPQSMEARQGLAIVYTFLCQKHHNNCPLAKFNIDWLIEQEPTNPNYFQLRAVYNQSSGDSIEAELDVIRAQMMLKPRNG